MKTLWEQIKAMSDSDLLQRIKQFEGEVCGVGVFAKMILLPVLQQEREERGI